ncbi:hypothetical protein BQ8794_260021 [Mesorhizobium prunaredense]|uniref:Uncharacterized protein n=1 Tax=Mesorhizobium prunaredense TaxID=1631249 RepID=A0A1R3V8E3_9HYPH|nr:hypothetical protein BQ8794_260021 [Mesorhizobium prunaredense]
MASSRSKYAGRCANTLNRTEGTEFLKPDLPKDAVQKPMVRPDLRVLAVTGTVGPKAVAGLIVDAESVFRK